MKLAMNSSGMITRTCYDC